MQFLSWAQKKLLNDVSPEKKPPASADTNYRDTSVEPDQWRPRLKNRRNEHHIARQMGFVTDSERVADTWSRPTLNPYFREDGRRRNKLQSVPRCSETMLTIGSLGVGELPDENEKDSNNESPILDDVSPIDILKIQEELQKNLYMSDGQPLQNDFPASYLNVERKSFKFHYGERDLTEKQVFPLQKFLEIPVMMEQTSDVAKKKHVFLQGLSSLFRSAVFSQRNLHDKAKETVKRIRISPFLLDKLLKIHSADSGYPPRYQGKLNKFLQLFRKRGAVSDKDNLKVDSKENGSSNVKALKCRGNVDDNQLPAGHDLRLGRHRHPIDDRSDILQNPCSWHLQLDDVQVFKAGNEYWIKTDDEYLVLEL